MQKRVQKNFPKLYFCPFEISPLGPWIWDLQVVSNFFAEQINDFAHVPQTSPFHSPTPKEKKSGKIKLLVKNVLLGPSSQGYLPWVGSSWTSNGSELPYPLSPSNRRTEIVGPPALSSMLEEKLVRYTCNQRKEATWRIILFNKWLGWPPFISHGVRPFGRRTTRSLGVLLTNAINHLLYKWDDPPSKRPRLVTLFDQQFQVPKMEGFLNLIAGYFGGGFSRT